MILQIMPMPIIIPSGNSGPMTSEKTGAMLGMLIILTAIAIIVSVAELIITKPLKYHSIWEFLFTDMNFDAWFAGVALRFAIWVLWSLILLIQMGEWVYNHILQ